MTESSDIDAELRRVYLFNALDAAQLKRVRRAMRALHLAEGERLFDHGQPADRFFLVHTGRIKLYRVSFEGAEKVIEIVPHGHTFAEAVMFMEHQSYPVSAGALAPSVLYSFDNKAFQQLLRDSVDTCFRLLGDMSMRLHARINEINALTLQNATLRLVGYLVRELEAAGGTGTVELPAAKNVVASCLSVQPETLSRIFHNLGGDGIIRVEGKRIYILDEARLRDYLH